MFIYIRWKLQAIVSCKHRTRSYNNVTGEGEVTTWDLVDDVDAINLVAFNLESHLMCSKLFEGKVKISFNSISSHCAHVFKYLYIVIRI